MFIGRCVAYRKTRVHGLLFIHCLLPRSSLHGLLFIHRRLPPASTCYCSSTVDFLQPPPATVHPRGPVHPASTGYCSTSPPRGPVQLAPSRGPIQPALHVRRPSTAYCSSTPMPPRSVSCSSSGNGLYYHGILFIQPTPGTIHPTLTRNCSSRGSFDRLQLAVVAKESLGFS